MRVRTRACCSVLARAAAPSREWDYSQTPTRVCPFAWHCACTCAACPALGPHRRRSPRSNSGVAGWLCQRHSCRRNLSSSLPGAPHALPGPAPLPSRLAKPVCKRARANACAHHPTHSARETTAVRRGPSVQCAQQQLVRECARVHPLAARAWAWTARGGGGGG